MGRAPARRSSTMVACANDVECVRWQTMARIEGVEPARAEGYIKRVFAAQAERWGAPLLNHLLYARRPSIFRGGRALWQGLDESGLIGALLHGLVVRLVSALNCCYLSQE